MDDQLLREMTELVRRTNGRPVRAARSRLKQAKQSGDASAIASARKLLKAARRYRSTRSEYRVDRCANFVVVSAGLLLILASLLYACFEAVYWLWAGEWSLIPFRDWLLEFGLIGPDTALPTSWRGIAKLTRWFIDLPTVVDLFVIGLVMAIIGVKSEPIEPRVEDVFPRSYPVCTALLFIVPPALVLYAL